LTIGTDFSLLISVSTLSGVSAQVTLQKNVIHRSGKAPADIKVQDKFDLSIQTPDLRAQRISKLILRNGLKVFIVSDPGIVKAGAALTVETGYWRDPPGVSGLGICHLKYSN
jgi:hypothetical protein